MKMAILTTNLHAFLAFLNTATRTAQTKTPDFTVVVF
jgi:hypothetical protein